MLEAYYKKGLIEAGCDEAGRGCLAGPVVAAAVILPEGFYHPLLNDSKQVTEHNRKELRDYIEEHAIAYAVSLVDNEVIDKINILKASFNAMHNAVDGLGVKPELLLIDGPHFSPYMGIVHQCVIKGDEKFASIAAASILAKTCRDDYMVNLHHVFPMYGWDENKGYGTAYHRAQIKKEGLSSFHRKTFGICKEMTTGITKDITGMVGRIVDGKFPHAQ